METHTHTCSHTHTQTQSHTHRDTHRHTNLRIVITVTNNERTAEHYPQFQVILRSCGNKSSMVLT